MWDTARGGAYSPLEALENAAAQRDVVEGLVPRDGITWLYGPSMSFKSFAAMGLAAAVAAGRSWLGRGVDGGAVVYVGAEGGDGLRVRRAAAERAQGAPGRLAVVSERPALDTATGLWELAGILDGVCSTFWPASGTGLFSGMLEEERRKRPDYAAAAEANDTARRQLRALRQRAKAGEAGLGGAIEGCEAEVTRARGRLEEAAFAFEGTATGRAFARASAAYSDVPDTTGEPPCSLLCVIDTYSQTAENDTRSSVSAYIKNLRRLIEVFADADFHLSFLVIDHVTKEGTSYLGSVAKLNDVDSQIEMVRVRKTNVAKLVQTKRKDGLEEPELIIELVPHTLDGFVDGRGRPLSTLVAREGAEAYRMAMAGQTTASALLDQLRAEGATVEAVLRDDYCEDRERAAGVQRASAIRTFNRAMEELVSKGLVVREGNMVRAF